VGNRLIKVEKRANDGGTHLTEVKYSYDVFGNRLAIFVYFRHACKKRPLGVRLGG
jgi:hypothetical protein